MLKAEQIPVEVMNEFHNALAHDESCAEAIAAAINAWPGVLLYPPDVLDNTINPTRIILPLPQENTNAEG